MTRLLDKNTSFYYEREGFSKDLLILSFKLLHHCYNWFNH